MNGKGDDKRDLYVVVSVAADRAATFTLPSIFGYVFSLPFSVSPFSSRCALKDGAPLSISLHAYGGVGAAEQSLVF